MIDPTYDLQTAIYNRLRTDAAVMAIVGASPARIYDHVPEDASLPYLTIGGPPQVLPDRADCIDGAEVFWTVDGWDDGPDSRVIKRLGAAVAASLDQYQFVLPAHRTVLCGIEQILYLNDPDGVTKHAAVNIRVLIEPT